MRRVENDEWLVAEALHLLGQIVQRQGELERAGEFYAESLKLSHEVYDSQIVVESVYVERCSRSLRPAGDF